MNNFFDEIMNMVSSEPFKPHAFYNKDGDMMEVYFKNDSCYTKTLNGDIEVHLSQENDEVVGLNILNVKKLMNL